MLGVVPTTSSAGLPDRKHGREEVPVVERVEEAAEHAAGSSGSTQALRQAPPWAWGLGLSILLCIAYLLASPPSADLAAATYRSDIFARAGFAIWDNGWYSGHSLPAYSLLSPALGAWIGLRPLLALSAVVGSAVYGLLAARILPRGAALASTLVFAFGFCTELPSGRVPYDLGVAIGLIAVLAFLGGRLALALALAVLTSVASPVSGAFLGLAGLAFALAALLRGQAGTARPADMPHAGIPHAGIPHAGALRDAAPARRLALRQALRSRDVWRGASLCAVSLAPILLLAFMFPEGGVEPFAPGAFWPELAAGIAFAALLPQGPFSVRAHLVLRLGAVLYVLSLIASFAIRTPVGGNVVRLGALFGAPLAVAALSGAWGAGAGAGAGAGGRGARGGHPGIRVPRWALLAVVAPLLLYWQLATSIDDQVALANDPTVQASYYAPLRAELLTLAGGAPIRVEVPLTGAHWESAYLPGGPISIARGWERQLDVRFGALFYGPSLAGARRLSASAYRRWLSANAIAYVAVPDARLDSAGRAEASLISHRLPPYLRQVWRSKHWRVFEVLDPTPLVQPPGRIVEVGLQSFAFQAPRAGSYLVHLHWTPYWAPPSRVCVSQGRDDLTEVHVSRPGQVRVGIDFSLSRVFEGGRRCGGRGR